MADYLSRDDANELCDTILSYSEGSAQVRILSGRRDFSNYTNNDIRASGASVNVEAIFTAVRGQRSGSVRWNDLRDAAIRTAVARAAALAEVAPDDPENMSLLGVQHYSASEAFFETTDELSDADQTDAIVTVAERAATAGAIAAGVLQRRSQSEAVANTSGLFAYHRSTLASHTLTVRTADGAGAGWDATSHNDWSRLESPADLADSAAAEARLSAIRADAQPGAQTVVLAPSAVGSLLLQLIRELDARTVDEGGSFLSTDGGGNKIGEQVVDERLTLFSDPGDTDLLGRPFTNEGAPIGRTTWIENGVLRNLAYSRYWAAQQNEDARPMDGGLKLVGGSGRVDELVAAVDRGLLITHPTRVTSMDHGRLPNVGVASGGTFLIEGGRPIGAANSLRLAGSLTAMLNNVEAIGSVERLVMLESGTVGFPLAAPALTIRDVPFISLSDAF